MQLKKHMLFTAVILGSSLALTACGGGGGGDKVEREAKRVVDQGKDLIKKVDDKVQEEFNKKEEARKAEEAKKLVLIDGAYPFRGFKRSADAKASPIISATIFHYAFNNNRYMFISSGGTKGDKSYSEIAISEPFSDNDMNSQEVNVAKGISTLGGSTNLNKISLVKKEKGVSLNLKLNDNNKEPEYSIESNVTPNEIIDNVSLIAKHLNSTDYEYASFKTVLGSLDLDNGDERIARSNDFFVIDKNFIFSNNQNIGSDENGFMAYLPVKPLTHDELTYGVDVKIKRASCSFNFSERSIQGSVRYYDSVLVSCPAESGFSDLEGKYSAALFMTSVKSEETSYNIILHRDIALDNGVKDIFVSGDMSYE